MRVHSKEQRKYAHLIRKLCRDIGCVRDPHNFVKLNLKERQPGLKRTFDVLSRLESFDHLVSNGWSDAEIRLILISPGEELMNRSPQGEKEIEMLVASQFR